MKTLFFLVALILLASQAGAQTTYHVNATGGSDNFSCNQIQSANTPARQVQKAINCVDQAGLGGADITILVHDGTYNGFQTSAPDNLTPLNVSGTSGHFFTIKAENIQKAVVVPSGDSVHVGTGNFAATSQGWIRLQGFKVDSGGGGGGISTNFAHDIEILDNWVTNTGSNTPAFGVVECITCLYQRNHCSVLNSFHIPGDPNSHCFYFLGRNAATGGTNANVTIDHTLIENLGNGGQAITSHGGADAPNQSNIIFSNNTQDSGSDNGGTLQAFHIAGLKVFNNIFKGGNGNYTLWLEGDETNVTFYSNLLIDRPLGDLAGVPVDFKNNILTVHNFNLTNGGSATFSNNLCPFAGTGCLVVAADPHFANAASGDYRLCTAAGAPVASCTVPSGAIDLGATLGSPYNVDATLPVAVSRPQGAGYDMGPFESGGGVTSPTVAISLPTPLATYVTTTGTVTLSGNATNAASITWANSAGGGGSTGGTLTAWNTPAITLQGNQVNTITITATNAAGSATANLQVAYSVPALVGSWAYDENGGTTALDRSGFANNGTFGAGATYVTNLANTYGISALSFSGGVVTVPDSASLKLIGGFTISARVYPFAAHTDYRAVLRKNAGYFLLSSSGSGFCSSNSILAGFDSSGGAQPFICAPAPLSINTYSCVAATYDGTNLKVYVNKSLVQTVAATGLVSVSTGNLTMGNDSFNEPQDGALDNVRLYNYDVGSTQIGTDCDTSIVPAGVANFRISGATGVKLKGATAAEIGH